MRLVLDVRLCLQWLLLLYLLDLLYLLLDLLDLLYLLLHLLDLLLLNLLDLLYLLLHLLDLGYLLHLELVRLVRWHLLVHLLLSLIVHHLELLTLDLVLRDLLHLHVAHKLLMSYRLLSVVLLLHLHHVALVLIDGLLLWVAHKVEQVLLMAVLWKTGLTLKNLLVQLLSLLINDLLVGRPWLGIHLSDLLGHHVVIELLRWLQLVELRYLLLRSDLLWQNSSHLTLTTHHSLRSLHDPNAWVWFRDLLRDLLLQGLFGILHLLARKILLISKALLVCKVRRACNYTRLRLLTLRILIGLYHRDLGDRTWLFLELSLLLHLHELSVLRVLLHHNIVVLW